MFASAPVLGIDPGVSRCGYGAVIRNGSTAEAVVAGVIETPTNLPLPERLALLADELDRLFADVQPGSVAVERVFFQANARTAMSVGQASGLALTAAARRGIPVTEYTPTEVKQAVAGYGAAEKRQVQAMVRTLLRLDAVPRPPDAADALALALCHLFAGPLRAQTQGDAAHRRVAGLDRAIAAAIAREVPT